MNSTDLIAGLMSADAYPGGAERIEIRQTHISVVFLAGDFAYKIKKPVNFGFLDFSTLEKRLHFCEEEVKLNRRLAAHVYLGVVPIVRTIDGLRLESVGEPVEWAVKMVRLPDEATLKNMLLRGGIPAGTIESLARMMAAFHRHAERGPHIAEFGRFEQIEQNTRENFEQCERHVGMTVSRPVFERVRRLTDEALEELRPTLAARVETNMPCDTHGDLRLGHVYLLPLNDLVIIDCIEFNERFRYADPVADMAFLLMDLLFHGAVDFAERFTHAYFAAADDAQGRTLLPFYTAYRAMVRAKVEGIRSREPEAPESERSESIRKAHAYWLLALGQLEQPPRRPRLVLMAGLPGSGKSTLARHLGERLDFEVIRSDVVRKELAGLLPSVSGPSLREDLYSAEWTARTYAECIRRAEQLLLEGRGVIVDATFAADAHRRTVHSLAAELCVPCIFLHCVAAPEIVQQRLESRQGDVSDADWRVHGELTRAWEAPSEAVRSRWHDIATGGSIDEAMAEVIRILLLASAGGDSCCRDRGCYEL